MAFSAHLRDGVQAGLCKIGFFSNLSSGEISWVETVAMHWPKKPNQDNQNKEAPK